MVKLFFLITMMRKSFTYLRKKKLCSAALLQYFSAMKHRISLITNQYEPNFSETNRDKFNITAKGIIIMCGEISFEYKLCRVTICGTEIQLRRLCTKHATPCSVHSAVHRQHLEHHRHCIADLTTAFAAQVGATQNSSDGRSTRERSQFFFIQTCVISPNTIRAPKAGQRIGPRRPQTRKPSDLAKKQY
jgi:hypothetical protein